MENNAEEKDPVTLVCHRESQPGRTHIEGSTFLRCYHCGERIAASPASLATSMAAALKDQCEHRTICLPCYSQHVAKKPHKMMPLSNGQIKEITSHLPAEQSQAAARRPAEGTA